MDIVPEVPNLLNWFAVFASVGAVLVALTIWIWRRWLSDVWAKRSRAAAKAQAEALIREFDEARALEDDNRRFQALCASANLNLVLCVLTAVLAIGSGVGATYMVIINVGKALHPLIWVLFFLAVVLFVLVIALFIKVADIREKYIMPFVDWDAYFAKTVERIIDLLSKADMDDREQGEFISSVSDLEWHNSEETTAPGDGTPPSNA